MKFAAKALALLSAISAVAAFSQGNPQGTIKHVIVIIQENRTPDFLFAGDTALPVGANIATSGKCKDSNGTVSTVTLQPQFLYGGNDIGHSYSDFVAMYDSGNMDGANSEFYLGGSHVCSSNPLPFGYARNDANTVPKNEAQPYFDIALHYGFANYMFQTNQGPSFPAHQFLFAGTSAPTAYPNPYFDYFASENPMLGGSEKGTPAGCLSLANESVVDISTSKQETNAYQPADPSGATPGLPCYDHNSIADVLDPHNIDWKYYAYDSHSLWAAPNAIESICEPSAVGGPCTGTDWPKVIRESPSNNPPNAGQILNDIMSCNLAKVSFVTPDGVWSDHAGGNTSALGPSWVAAIVNAIGQGIDPACQTDDGTSNYWKDTVILVTWDDWGGWYDHVAPPSATGYIGGLGNGQQYVYGFRVPLLVVSAYAKPGYVSGPNGYNTCPSTATQYCHDFGSILNFIEYVFGTGNQSLGEINSSYHYADYYALDASPNCPITTCPYALSDFFDFTTFHNFTPISAPESALYFMSYNGVSQPPDLD